MGKSILRNHFFSKVVKTSFLSSVFVLNRIHVPLSQRSRDGYKVFYAALQDTDPSHYDFNAAIKLLIMMFDPWVILEGTDPGYIVVLNAKGGQMGHAARVNPAFLKRSIQYLQEAAPIRLKGVHFININPVINVVLNIAKPFMQKELMDLVSIQHCGGETVQRQYDKISDSCKKEL